LMKAYLDLLLEIVWGPSETAFTRA
jgi:hypothetical protein